MGEIKSTLDLVMERTRHLTLSDAERREQEARERRGRMRGLVQKYEDFAVTAEQFVREWAAVEGRDRAGGDRLLAREVAVRCDPEGENRRWLELLAFFGGSGVDRLEALCRAYREELDALRLERARAMRLRLSERGVGGSAVVPNLARDDAWATGSRAIRSRFADAFAREALRLVAAVRRS